jgi:hypothetical protein
VWLCHPDTERPENVRRGDTDSGNPEIVSLIRGKILGARVFKDYNPEPTVTQRIAESGAYHAAANDEDIELFLLSVHVAVTPFTRIIHHPPIEPRVNFANMVESPACIKRS